jgi:hypothetical protein
VRKEERLNFFEVDVRGCENGCRWKKKIEGGREQNAISKMVK